MFTIKVTYGGQIRKHTFSDIYSFPPYDDICSQLNRAFSLSNNVYWSKLLFSPDAAQASRILISKEVRNAHDYSKCIRQFKNRTWPHALLRFNVIDSASYFPEINIPSGMSMSTEASQPPAQYTFTRNPVPRVRLPMEFSGVPRAAASQTAMDVDFVPPTQTLPTGLDHAQFDRPTAQRRAFSGSDSCCSVSRGNAEMRAILNEFKVVVDNALAHTSKQTSSTVGEAPPPSLCSICTRGIGTYRDGRGDWYSCESCHIVVCDACHKEDKPGFCLSNMGSHIMKIATSSQAPSIPHLPIPWATRSNSASINTPFIDLSNIQDTERQAPSSAQAQASVPSPPVIHAGVLCDVCNVVIEGVRHKCLDCPDYDLCTSCINNGAAGTHNPFHEFFDIAEPGRVVVHTVYSGDGERESRRASTRPAAPENPPTEIHHATCDLCDSRILGNRYKCAACPDFDVCNSCFSIAPEQHPHHAFVRIRKREDYVQARSSPRPMHFATCDACHRTIYGTRFKCMHPNCADYDLCESCEALPILVHPANHPMLKMRSPETVIPTVYRVGQTQVIPQQQQTAPRQDASPATVMTEPKTATPFGSIPPTSFPPIVVEEQRIRTPTPTPRVASVPIVPWVTGTMSPVKPPVPPKPEMMSHPSWASIPGFFGSSSFLEPEMSENRPGLTRKASLKNPFADIPLPDTPTASGPAEQPSDLTTDIKLPTVPSHTPTNPWPTTNPTERQELLQLIADFSGSTSPEAVRLADNGFFPKVDETRNVLQPTAPEVIAPTIAKPEPSHAQPSEEEAGKKGSTNDFPAMERLLKGFEERVASLKVAVETKAASLSEASSLSNEALLRHPSEAVSLTNSTASYHPSLAHLISELPSLVPKSPKSDEVDPPKPRISLSAAFVEDVTVPDGQTFPPGAEFMKCWRLLNDSAKEWPESTELVFVAGESLLGNAVPLPIEVGKVAAGAEVDVWTGELKAPDVPGRYVGYWRLKADGEIFGNSLWIEINVVESDSHHSSDESMAASSIIMPTASSSEASKHVPSTTVKSSTGAISLASTDEDISDTASDISLVSLPSMPSDDEDEALFHDSRSFTMAERAAQAGDGAASPTVAQPTNTNATTMDYVLLYDDNSSESD